MARKEHNYETITVALVELAEELIMRGYHAALVIPERHRPSLTVRNPKVPVRACEVIADAGWFWWPDALKIAAMTEVATAAQLIVHLLHLGCDCHD